MKFKVGDRVKLLTQLAGVYDAGDTGVINKTDDSKVPYCVLMDNQVPHFKEIWKKENEIELVEEEKGKEMKHKFKVGDKVKIIEAGEYDDERYEMYKTGSIGEIIHDDKGDVPYLIAFKKGDEKLELWEDDDCIALVEEGNNETPDEKALEAIKTLQEKAQRVDELKSELEVSRKLNNAYREELEELREEKKPVKSPSDYMWQWYANKPSIRSVSIGEEEKKADNSQVFECIEAFVQGKFDKGDTLWIKKMEVIEPQDEDDPTLEFKIVMEGWDDSEDESEEV